MLRVAAPHWRAEGLIMDVLETSREPGHFGEQLTDAGYTVLRLPLTRRPADVLNLRRLIANGKYDVVHIHTEGADLIPGLAARLAGTSAVIRTVHHIFPYQGWLRRRKRLERRLNRLLGTLYVCNSRSGSHNETHTLHNPHRLVFNWYDDNHFIPPTDVQRATARASLAIREDQVAFVSVGGCAAYKNHHLILEALVETPDVLYLHAGPEPDDSERRLADDLGIANRARFLGIVPDVLDVFYAADGYLMPSTIEGFGVAATEALGCGVPVILSDRPALSDLKGLTPGIWVPPEVQPLAAAMQRLSAMSIEQRRQEGAEASLAVSGLFGAKAGADGYLDVYLDALRRRH
jgi:glycosyltransferase involved in cell wall biosynthesis